MSQQNVEAFRRGIDAFNARDVEALLEEIDRNVEWHPGLAGLLGGEATVHRGHDGVRQLVRDLYESFVEIHVELSEIRDLDDRVVAIGRLRGRGIESGVYADSPAAYVAHFKTGRLILLRTYLDPTEALEAAGLREQVMSQENVDLVRRGFEFTSATGQLLGDIYQPDFVWDTTTFSSVGGLGMNTESVGFAAANRWLAEWTGGFEDWSLDVEEEFDAGDQVVTFVRQHAKAKHGGPDVEMRFAQVWTFRDGLIARMEMYADRAEALEAAGLRE